MTATGLAALFAAMLVLAATPSMSVLLVTTKSASLGFAHGASAAAGVVVGDLIFILVAVFGLAVLVETTGSAWDVLKYIAAAYLVWLGTRYWRAGARPQISAPPRHTSLPGSFMAGLLLTLADQKAVLFYLAFLPAFLDLNLLSGLDLFLLVAATFVAVGGVKLAYAYAGARAGKFMSTAIGGTLNRVAAGLLLLVAVTLVVRG